LIKRDRLFSGQYVFLVEIKRICLVWRRIAESALKVVHFFLWMFRMFWVVYYGKKWSFRYLHVEI